MAYEGTTIVLPDIVAQGDLSSSQHCVMKYASTAGRVKKVTATTDTAIGILLNQPDATNEAASVAVFGVVKALAGTSVGFSQGERVGYNTTGVSPANTGVSGTKSTIGFYVDSNTTVTSGSTLVSIMLTGGCIDAAN